MTSPLENIKNGIAQGDLNLVAEGYAALTGETVKPPQKKKVEQPKSNPYNDLRPIFVLLKQIFDKEKVPTQQGEPTDPYVPEYDTDNAGQVETFELKKNNKGGVSIFGTTQKVLSDTVDDPEIVENTNKMNEIVSKNPKKGKREPFHKTIFTYKCDNCENDYETSVEESDDGHVCKDCIAGAVKDEGEGSDE
jgi:hypothetical protein